MSETLSFRKFNGCIKNVIGLIVADCIKHFTASTRLLISASQSFWFLRVGQKEPDVRLVSGSPVGCC